jgi:hypothetical protein
MESRAPSLSKITTDLILSRAMKRSPPQYINRHLEFLHKISLEVYLTDRERYERDHGELVTDVGLNREAVKVLNCGTLVYFKSYGLPEVASVRELKTPMRFKKSMEKDIVDVSYDVVYSEAPIPVTVRDSVYFLGVTVSTSQFSLREGRGSMIVSPEAIEVSSLREKLNLDWQCEKLRSLHLNIPRVKITASLHLITYSHLTSLDIKAPSLESLGDGSFHSLKALTLLELYLPSLTYIGKDCFHRLDSLKELNLYLPRCFSRINVGVGVNVLEYFVEGQLVERRYDGSYKYSLKMLKDDSMFIDGGYERESIASLTSKESDSRWKIIGEEDMKFNFIDNYFNEEDSNF